MKAPATTGGSAGNVPKTSDPAERRATLLSDGPLSLSPDGKTPQSPIALADLVPDKLAANHGATEVMALAAHHAAVAQAAAQAAAQAQQAAVGMSDPLGLSSWGGMPPWSMAGGYGALSSPMPSWGAQLPVPGIDMVSPLPSSSLDGLLGLPTPAEGFGATPGSNYLSSPMNVPEKMSTEQELRAEYLEVQPCDLQKRIASLESVTDGFIADARRITDGYFTEGVHPASAPSAQVASRSTRTAGDERRVTHRI